jgi:hypothetical protein
VAVSPLPLAPEVALRAGHMVHDDPIGAVRYVQEVEEAWLREAETANDPQVARRARETANAIANLIPLMKALGWIH